MDLPANLTMALCRIVQGKTPEPTSSSLNNAQAIDLLSFSSA